MKKKNESNIKDLWNNIKQANLNIVGIPKKKQERGLKIYLEKLWKNFPKPKETNYLGTRSTVGPKQEEPRQTFTKIYHN